jgi:UDP-glucose 4-epimerase
MLDIKGKHHWLITGCAGFIGFQIIHLLVENGQKVCVFDNLSGGNLANIKDISAKITFIQGDIASKKDLAKLPKPIDYILHVAGQISGPQSIADPLLTNVQGTLNIFEFAYVS